ncbi:MAG: exodeoxyribonuclease VII large subunit [Gammaproteobacteria bacterium]|nr:exodeoxyribonuclease VII large subunit [Gammaproteobacteria bacterium]
MSFETADPLRQRDVMTVGRLNAEVRAVLEGSFPLLWVTGEISNLAQPRSGHLYFSLKDAQAQVRCAMFRMKRIHLRFAPTNGLHVTLRGRVSLYEDRGDFQLIVEHMEAAGEGALQQAFEALKRNLNEEGLFAPERKKPLPRFPRRIGVITSPSGAALHDVLTVLGRRYPSAEIILYPVQVQGTTAATEIEQAIALADRRAECDLLLLTRGGGSLEDLAAFNDERVARAIHACALPLVSAVGHEVDFTIADFVADQRAATPSAAAELISPDSEELALRIARLGERLGRSAGNSLRLNETQLKQLTARLQRCNPGHRIAQGIQRRDEFAQRLELGMQRDLRHRGALLQTLCARLAACSPRHELKRVASRHDLLLQRLHYAADAVLERQRHSLGRAVSGLHTLSPLATLTRGYSITRRESDQGILFDAAKVAVGERLETLLAKGSVVSKVVARNLERR